MSEQFLADRGHPAVSLDRSDSTTLWSLEEPLQYALGAIVRPRHNWLLIFLMALGYIGLVGPVNWLIGRRTRGHWLTLAFLLGVVAMTALGFGIIGRRGYGESTAIHTLCYARALGEGEYDVTQWSNVFVTSGRRYRFSHPGAHALFATCQEHESVNGLAQSGLEGFFDVDMPVFSNRALKHRAKLKGEPMAFEAVWSPAGESAGLPEFKAGSAPKDVLAAWAVRGDSVYTMAWSGARLAATGGGQPLAGFGSPEELWQERYGMSRRWEEKRSEKDIFQTMAQAVAAWAAGSSAHSRYFIAPQPYAKDAVDLFLFTRSPDVFKMSCRYVSNEVSYTVYHLRFLPPGATP